MTLRDWLKNGWLNEHQTSREEIADLLGISERDLVDCQIIGLSPDWRLGIAYDAALLAATAALAAAGYRAARESHHYRVVQSLAHTIGADASLIAQLNQFRKKRNIGGYERAGMISEQEAAEMFALAQKIIHHVKEWLRAHHPDLFPE